MKKILLFFFLIIITADLSAQRRKKFNWQEDIRYSIDPHIKIMTAFGNNMMSDALSYFYGFGIGANANIYKNFGLGVEYTYFMTNIKKSEMFGYLGAPSMNNFDWYVFHKNKITEDFFVEELIGYSTYRMKSPYLDNSEKFSEGNGGLHLGGKAIYTLDMEATQQIVFGARLSFYNAKIANQNPDISKYYSKATFINLSLAYRINF